MVLAKNNLKYKLNENIKLLLSVNTVIPKVGFRAASGSSEPLLRWLHKIFWCHKAIVLATLELHELQIYVLNERLRSQICRGLNFSFSNYIS